MWSFSVFQVSPHWFRWLINTWQAYGLRTDLAAISLQKPKISVYGEENLDVDIAGKVNTPVFLYELSGIGSAVGLSPHPVHWAEFLSRHGSLMSTCPPGLMCADPDIWEPWWFYYCLNARLFTLFLAHPKTMATQHREAGVHEKAEATKKDFDYVEEWQQTWEKQKLPKKIPRLSLSLEPIPDFLYRAKIIHDKHGVVLLTVLDENDDLSSLEMLDHLEKVLFISPASFCSFNNLNLVHIKEPMKNISHKLPQREAKDFILLKILMTLVQHKLHIQTIPLDTKILSKLKIPSRNNSYNLLAGRSHGQMGPSLNNMWWDGKSEEVFKFILFMVNNGVMSDFKEAFLRFPQDMRQNLRWKWF